MSPKPITFDSDSRLIRFCDRAVEIMLYLAFFLVPVFFIILTRDQFELPKLTVLRILTAGMLGAWLIRIIAARRFEFRRTPLDIPILAWLSYQIAITLHSVSISVSWLGEYENFRGLLTIGNYVALYYLAVNFIRTRVQIDRLLFVILLAGLTVTAYGIAQFIGIDFIAWNPASVAKGRYFSSLGNPNFLAAYLAMVMPLVVIFFVETSSRFRRFLLFLCFIAMFFALMGTWSRGGFLGLLAALGVLLIFGLLNVHRYYRNLAAREHLTLGGLIGREAVRHKVWVGVITLTVALLVLISATFGRQHMVRVATSVVHIKEAITVSRLHIWGPALKIFKTYPLFGTGLDTFKTVFPRFATPAFAAIDGANVASRTAHNEILQVLSTQGLIGFGLVTWLTIAVLLNWLKAYRRRQDDWRDRLILYGLLGTWTAYSIQNIFSFGVAAIDTFYWLLLAVIVLLQASREEQPRLAPSQTPDPKPAPFFAALARIKGPAVGGALILTAWLAWKAYSVALADFSYNIASVYRNQGLWDMALNKFTAAARLMPLEVKYVVYEGLAYEEKAKSISDSREQLRFILMAVDAYRRGLRLNPTNAYYLGNLGRAYGLAADLARDKPEYYERAVSYYRAAIDNAPVTALFYHNLGMMYLARGNEAAFTELLTRMEAFDPAESSKLAFTAANQFYSLGDPARAERYYRLALEKNPKYVEAYFNLGVTLAGRRETAQAMRLWQQALEIKPDFEPARQMLLRFQSASQVHTAGNDILMPQR